MPYVPGRPPRNPAYKDVGRSLSTPDDTILCWTWPEELKDLTPSDQDRHVTVRDCNEWLAEGHTGRSKLAAFFRQRMGERYVEPVERLEPDEKNGFPIMALSCLLIESLQTFREGWPSSDGKSAQAFCYFFGRESAFATFRGHMRGFYEHVRCGILHQGETTGGWTITRKKGVPLFEAASLRINATEFHRLLAKVIDGYADELKSQPLSSEVWQRFRKKLKAMIKNCER
jgi:hypothetical protein